MSIFNSPSIPKCWDGKKGWFDYNVSFLLFYFLARTMLLLMQFSLKKTPKQNTTNQTAMESLYVCSDNLQLVLSPLCISLCLHVLPFTVSGF